MSVTTDVDRNLQEAKEHLDAAYQNLLKVLDEGTWGHNEMSEERLDSITQIFIEVRKLKKKL